VTVCWARYPRTTPRSSCWRTRHVPREAWTFCDYFNRLAAIFSKIFSGKGKVVPVLNELSTTPWRRMGSECIDPHFLDLDTSWRWVVSFTLRPLYSRGKSPRYALNRRLGWLQSRLDDLQKRKLLTLPGLDLRSLSRPARSQSLYRLRCPGF
jgi:hypothetical protein